MRKLLPALALAIACSCDEPRDPSKSPTPSTKDLVPPPPAAPPSPQSFGIAFEPPAEWRPETPASNMRKAQYAVPDKDKAEGSGVFIYFGTMGGGVEGNMTRWKSQFLNQPAPPTVEEIKSGDRTIHLLDISGEYASDMGADAKPDQRGLFAIIAMADGDHIFRLTGPRGTVADWRDAFVEMLKKARPR